VTNPLISRAGRTREVRKRSFAADCLPRREPQSDAGCSIEIREGISSDIHALHGIVFDVADNIHKERAWARSLASAAGGAHTYFETPQLDEELQIVAAR
jgi:hypothetical protein